jgi:7,8-dihydropterin-6-yl-methyl-4-(beta-D-ribofuranosyl)aminobenzene 5'-phosphate synthase
MKIITLVENTCGAENCIAEHGLSIYIETEKHKLLLDTGQTDAVVKNAEDLGIDLTAVDTVILSHGHYDHSGGILPFSELNHTAQIIMQKKAAAL